MDAGIAGPQQVPVVENAAHPRFIIVRHQDDSLAFAQLGNQAGLVFSQGILANGHRVFKAALPGADHIKITL